MKRILILSLLISIFLVGCGSQNTANIKQNVEKELSNLVNQSEMLEGYELNDNLTTLTLIVNSSFEQASFNEKLDYLKELDRLLTNTILVEDQSYNVDNINITIKNSNRKVVATYDNGIVDIK